MRTHSRRALFGAGIAVAGSGLLSGCATGTTGSGLHSGMDGMNGMNAMKGMNGTAPSPDTGGHTPSGYVSPDGPEVAEAERRRGAGPVRRSR